MSGGPRKPRRAKPAPAPTTPDPIEIAMEAEAGGRAPQGVAERVLVQHERLICWQVANERAAFALRVLTAAAGLAAAVVLVAFVWSASQAQGLVVDPFLTPPSLAEDGGVDALKSYGTYAIYALLAPAGTPPAVINALSEALKKVSAMPDVVQKLETANVRASWSSPTDLTQYLEKEVAKWKEVGKKVKVE